MQIKPFSHRTYTKILPIAFVFLGLYISSLYNYLLFHSLSEIFSIIIACAIFMVVWNSQRFFDNSYLAFLGIAYLFVGGLDLAHMLAYKGMGIFEGFGANLPAQLWIAARYVESLSLLIALFFLDRQLRVNPLGIGFVLFTTLLLGAIFYWKIFPDCFVEGVGLTTFKKFSEYIICLILSVSAALLIKKRDKFDKGVLQLLIYSVIFTIGAELAFTFYISVYGLSNLIGHFFKIISFYLIYKAVIETGLVKPYSLLFRNLKQKEEALKDSHAKLEVRVQERTAELAKANEELQAEITVRKDTEEALRNEKEKFQTLVEKSPFGISLIGKDNKYKYINPEFIEIFGYTLEDVPTGREWFEKALGQEYRNQVRNMWITDQEESKIGEPTLRTFSVACKDGSEKEIQFIPMSLDTGDQLVIYKDVTKEKKMEAQLIQSQKMEAIGRLAGGVAHDFNNLLTIVIGFSELMIMNITDDNPLKGNIVEIKKAAERGTSLVRQLLAFSRKQALQPEVLNFNSVTREMDKMLQRVIGEDIELATLFEPDLSYTKIDPGQIMQVIMNLVVNAKDSMPQGGKITIETANVYLDEAYARTRGVELKPGSYVMLAITDTGIGMDGKTQSRIFEPFYTTKGEGKGTGLGLATVYGIVKQSGGFIWVYSEPSRGTTFKIYFPKYVGEDPEWLKKERTQPEKLSGEETILLVEDDDVVLSTTRDILHEYGYNVLDARDGKEALLIYEKHKGPIHLMLTDVVMPIMSGYETAKGLHSVNPDIKVLYMSGYANNAIVRHGVLDPTVSFIQKPFSPASLARKVRETLDHR